MPVLPEPSNPIYVPAAVLTANMQPSGIATQILASALEGHEANSVQDRIDHLLAHVAAPWARATSAASIPTAKLDLVTLNANYRASEIDLLLSTGSAPILRAATAEAAGLMTAADRVKFTGIETGATADLTAAEIVTLLEALSGDARLRAAAVRDLADETFRGDWDRDTAYARGEIVRHFDHLWICRQDQPADSASGDVYGGPDGNPDYWEPLSIFRGDWSNGWYEPGDMVKHAGHVWVAITSVRTSEPGPDGSTKWARVSNHSAAEVVALLEALTGDARLQYSALRGVPEIEPSFPPPWSATEAYETGDYVTFDDRVYRARTDHTNTEPDPGGGELQGDWEIVFDGHAGLVVGDIDTRIGNWHVHAEPDASYVGLSLRSSAGSRLDAATSTRAGAMSAAQASKLEGVEAGATADQTAAEIIAAIEGRVGDERLRHSALRGVPAPFPPPWSTDAQYAIGDQVHRGDVVYEATAAHAGVEPGVAAGWEDSWTELFRGGAAGLDEAAVDARIRALRPVAYTTAEQTKLGAIEAGATADQTATEVRDLLAGLAAGSRLNYSHLDGTPDISAFVTQADIDASIVRDVAVWALTVDSTRLPPEKLPTVTAAAQGAMSAAEHTKLAGIEENATARYFPPAWEPFGVYDTGDLVYAAGVVYRSEVDSNLANDPTQAAERANWAIVFDPGGEDQVFPPEWHPGRAYAAGVTVRQANKVFIASGASTDINPGITDGWEDHWTLIFDGSDDGVEDFALRKWAISVPLAKLSEAHAGQRGTMSAAHFSKLEAIEAGATADQTGAEVRDLLAALTGDDRLPFSALRDAPAVPRERFRGDWSGGTAYLRGDIVVQSHGFFICRADRQTNQGPRADPDHWAALTLFWSDWSNGHYFAGKIVSEGGFLWVAGEQVSAGDPAPSAADNTKWVRISIRTLAEMDARIEIWARPGSADLIPAAKLVNAPIPAFSLTTSHSATYAEIRTSIGGQTAQTQQITGATASIAGLMLPGHFSKLGGIETGATADQTAAEIRDLLAALTGTGRLSYTSLKDTPAIPSVEDWAADTTTPIPASKLTNAPSGDPFPMPWAAGTAYATGAYVAHNNRVYRALAGSTGIEPGVTDGWGTSWNLVFDGTVGPPSSGLTQEQVDARIATWARAFSPSGVVPDDRLPNALIGVGLVGQQMSFSRRSGGAVTITLPETTDADIDARIATWARASGATGTAPPERLGTGSRDGSLFLRDDGVWASPPAGDGGGEGTAAPTNLGHALAAAAVALSSSTGSGTTIPAATSSLAGVMSAALFSKLDGIEAGATADQTGAEIRALLQALTGNDRLPYSAIRDTPAAAAAWARASGASGTAPDDRLPDAVTDGSLADGAITLTRRHGAARALTLPEGLTDVALAGSELRFTRLHGSRIDITLPSPGTGASPTNLGNTPSATDVEVTSSTGSNTTLPAATAAAAGVLTAALFSKLGGIEAGATADQTGAEVRDLLAALTGDDRLSFSSLKDTPAAPASWARASGATGRAPVGTLGSGSPSGSTWLRGDGAWAALPDLTQATNLGNTPSATDVEVTSSTGDNTTLPAATATAAGMLTAALFSKLDGLAAPADWAKASGASGLAPTARLAGGTAGASKFLRGDQMWATPPGTTDLGNTPGAAAVEVTSSTGDNTTLPAATATAAGVLTAALFSKLDGIETGATADQTGAEVVALLEALTDNARLQASAVRGLPATDLGNTPAASTVEVTSSTGDNTTLPAATVEAAGVMTAADKVSLRDLGAAGSRASPTVLGDHVVTSGPGSGIEVRTNETRTVIPADGRIIITVAHTRVAGTTEVPASFLRESRETSRTGKIIASGGYSGACAFYCDTSNRLWMRQDIASASNMRIVIEHIADGFAPWGLDQTDN